MTPETTTSDAALQELRDQVSETDRAIVELVNRRLDLVRRIWRRKEELGLAVVDPQREARMVEALEQANSGPLSGNGLRELHAHLLALTKRELGR
jgi:chorismate mutase/prephenate dehydratase